MKFSEKYNQLKEEKMKFSFSRFPNETGRAGMAYDNAIRSYEVKLNGKEIGFISNVSNYALSKDKSREWAIWFYGKSGVGNFSLKKRFKEDEIESAKEFFKTAYQTIVDNKDDKYTEMKNRLKELTI